MIPGSTLEKKSLRYAPANNLGTHLNAYDGPRLGGCGVGEVGDPFTYLPAVWEAMLDLTAARSVLDVGCGMGYSTRWFASRVPDVLGLEGSPGVVHLAVTPLVQHHDFAHGRPDPGEFDLCWCSEFLEHVEERHLPNVFAAFVRCKTVVISAALPGFGGHHHVNEQPPSYWIDRFAGHGFEFDEAATDRLRELAHECQPGSYFARNGLMFRRVRVVEPRRLWTDVPGGLTGEQGEWLREACRGKTVLELGAGRGRATACMAETAKSVTAVDDHLGGTRDDFEANLEYFGLQSKVEPIEGDIDDLRDSLAERRFHVVFIDGERDADSVERDTLLAMECLLPGGAVVWQGYESPGVPEGIARTGVPLELINPPRLRAPAGLGCLPTERWQVAVTVPHSRGIEPRSMKAAMRGAAGLTADQVCFLDFAYGCLEHNFNVLLAACLGLRDQGKCTHMAMLHSDVYAEPGWVDVLAEEMCRTRAAAISAVVAIKDPDDDRTSTAIGVRDDPWRLARFVRLRDRERMPETFTEQDVCSEDGTEQLLINTGCMLIDLSHEFWDDYAFHVESRIVREADGSRTPQFLPEDWNLSRDLDAANLPYAATWKVEAKHIGVAEWPNRPRPGFLSNG